MVDRTEQASVVVVGCGPGGAVLSYLLARSGVSVALLERAATFEREYRGFGWNPGVVRLFDEMDLLEDVLSLAHETVTDGAFSLAGEQMSVLDFDLLETAYPYALMMEQPALLERLVERSRAYDGFSFHPATTVTGVRENATGHVCGVDAIDRAIGEEAAFEAPVVVGADGRYSTVRESAGIDAGMFDSPIDLVWFKLPAGAVQVAAQGRLAGNGVVLYFGLGAFRDRVAAVDPQLGPVLDEHLDGFADTSLLDVAPGIAPTWTDDGLLLLGDAAHTASPIGAQGTPPPSRMPLSSTSCSSTHWVRNTPEVTPSRRRRWPGLSGGGGRRWSGSLRSSAGPHGGWLPGSITGSTCRHGLSAGWRR